MVSFVYHVYVTGMQGMVLSLSSLQTNTFANRADPDETARSEPSYQDHTVCISKTCLYNFDPLKPHFYIVKLGFTGVYIIFLISAQKHSEAVLTSTHNLCF